MCVCVCVCERERERERASVHVAFKLLFCIDMYLCFEKYGYRFYLWG